MVTARINFPQYAVVSFITISAFLCHQSGGRQLRPSDHGLSFQEDSLPPTQSADGQEMRTFFGSSSSSIPLPEAQNISDTWMSAHADERSFDHRRDHVKVGLLVASAVCGLTGVVLLVVSGVIYLFRIHNGKRKLGLGAEGRSESEPGPGSLPHAVNDKQ